MNYTELCTAVQDTVENSFTADQLALFCDQAERAIYNAVQIPALRKSTTAALTTNNQYLTLPGDFLYPYSLSVLVSGTYNYLVNKDVNYVREAYPVPTSTGVPKYYAIFDGNSLILGPTPDSAYTVELHYGYYPESIVTAGTSWLGDNFDSALYNGMLVEAARFLRLEDNTVTLYGKLLENAMSQLKQLGDGKLRQDTYRSGQVRVPVR